MVFCIVVCYVVLCCVVVLYCIALYCIVLYCIISYHIVLNHIILYSIIIIHKVDHVIVSCNISDQIVSCNIIDSIQSDHVPIKTVIELEIPIRPFSGNASDSAIHDPYVDWHRAKDKHINGYKELLHHQLSELALSCNMNAFKCSDVCCTDHVREMHNIYYNVIKACNDSARKCIPSIKGTFERSDWQAGMIVLKNTTHWPYTGIIVGKLRDVHIMGNLHI